MNSRLFKLTCSVWLLLITTAAADDALFGRLDNDGDGFVDAEEVSQDHQRLFARLLRQADKNDDGRLDATEFTSGITAVEPPAGQSAGGNNPRQAMFSPQQMFRNLDRNRDGKLTKAETPQRITDKFDRIDRNGDGAIQLPELTQAINAYRSQMQRNRKPNANGATPQQKAEFARRMFQQRDNNRDGKLSLDEVPQERRDGFRRLLTRLDDDNDNALTRQQFIQAISQTPNQ